MNAAVLPQCCRSADQAGVGTDCPGAALEQFTWCNDAAQNVRSAAVQVAQAAAIPQPMGSAEDSDVRRQAGKLGIEGAQFAVKDDARSIGIACACTQNWLCFTPYVQQDYDCQRPTDRVAPQHENADA